LRALQRLGATTRLNQLAERIKIELGDLACSDADLAFIENDLAIEVGRQDLLQAADDFSQRLRRLLAQARDDMAEKPLSIFLTGGSSRSPLLREDVRASFPGVVIVAGDPSLGVVSGLAAASSKAA
jgi:hypothetical chaperone protein